jgi:hypothetical protein
MDFHEQQDDLDGPRFAIEATCKWCERTFDPPKSLATDYERFCSRECERLEADEARREREEM